MLDAHPVLVVTCSIMRSAPKLTDIPRYPVVAGTALLAIGVTVAWWAKLDISPLVTTAMIRRGELWRLVTSILPHGGVLHLVFNIYWLWVFGTLIEEVYGHFKTALLILLFTVGSSAFEFAFAVGGVGLSGVGYGLFGLLWVLSRYDERFHDAVDRSTVQLFIGWFFFCIVATLAKIMSIANIAHGTGAVLGILTGFSIVKGERRFLSAAGTVALLLFALWAATLGRPTVNLSGSAGYEEGEWGYEALVLHHYPEAARWFHDAVTYQPRNATYWYDLGISYQALNNKPLAIAAYRKAADQGESKAQYFLGTLYEGGTEGLPKDPAQALYWYRKAVVLGDADTLNNIAWSYATSHDPAIRDPKAALECARKAVTLDKDDPDPNHLDTLAEAYYVNEQYEDAVKMEQQAIALASQERKVDFQKNLEKYQLALKDRKRQTNVSSK